MRCARLRRIQRETSRAHSSGISESTLMRARTSSPSFVSCVDGREHLERPVVRAVHGCASWNSCDRPAEARRIAADLVERQQHVVAVERRVLEALGLHRPGVLLELHREPQPLARFRRRRPAGSRRGARPAGDRRTSAGIARQHHLAEEIEERRSIAGLRRRARAIACSTTARSVGVQPLLVDVGAVDREAGDDLA